MNKKDCVLEYVVWKLEHDEEVKQKYLDYLDNLDLLSAAIKMAG